MGIMPEEEQTARKSQIPSQKQAVDNQKAPKKRRTGLLVLLPILVLVTAGLGAAFIPRLFGYTLVLRYDYEQVETYTHDSPALSFDYNTQVMEIDMDEENKYGDNYIVGLKVIDDPRTGCDVRLVEQQLDLDRPVEEVARELSDELGSGSADFASSNAEYTMFGDKKAIEMQISFVGPLGDAAALRQVFIPEGEKTYTLICGGNKSLMKFYQEEYDRFFNSFTFN